MLPKLTEKLQVSFLVGQQNRKIVKSLHSADKRLQKREIISPKFDIIS